MSGWALEDLRWKSSVAKVTLNLPKGLPFIPEGYEINYELINKNVILPSDKELDENNRSHSAKMRGIEKL